MGLKMRTKFACQSGVPRTKLSSCRMFEAEMRFRLIKNPDAIRRRDSEMLVSVVMIMMVLMKMTVMMVVRMPLLLLLVALM